MRNSVTEEIGPATFHPGDLENANSGEPPSAMIKHVAMICITRTKPSKQDGLEIPNVLTLDFDQPLSLGAKMTASTFIQAEIRINQLPKMTSKPDGSKQSTIQHLIEPSTLSETDRKSTR
jgi:hypothetical protein